MKKIFFALLAFFATMSADAQTLKVMKGDKLVAIYKASEVDEVVYEDDAAKLVTPQDDWFNILTNAEPDEAFKFAPGEYMAYTLEGGTRPFTSIQIKNSLKISAANPADMPVLKGFNFKLKDGASLDLSNLVIDGNYHMDQFIIPTQAGAIDHINISGCEISNYAKGFIYINAASVVNNITIDNCIIHDIDKGGDLFDSRKGGYNEFNLTNSTLYRCVAKRDVFRYDDASATVTATSKIKVDHCTFAEVGNGAADFRIFYVRFKGNSITFTNNIVADFNNNRGFSDQGNTATPEFGGNYYFNTKNLLSLAEGSTGRVRFFDTTGKELSETPFQDAAMADYTVVNADVAKAKAGDPRWIK